MAPLLLLFGLKDAFMSFGSAILQPIYWAVSGLIVLAHKIWSPLFGDDSGLTWVLSIVTLVIVIRTLLIPLFVKQINTARDMQLIQPKVRALQEKFGSDRERLSQETMKLYREEGVNPAASCLPLLLQMPIFLALYRVLEGAAREPVIPRGTFFKNNPELVDSLHDATVWGASLAGKVFPFADFNMATKVMAVVLIVLMTAVLFIQQKELMQRNMPPEALVGPAAQTQKMMLYVFPFMYAITGVSIPVGVLVYWLTTNLWTLAQQYILIRHNPTPGTPAYLDWQERMRKKGKDPEAVEAERRRKRSRSATVGAVRAPEPTPGERATIERQNVSRTTTRTTSRPGGNGQQVVRRQPNRQTSRQARKKK